MARKPKPETFAELVEALAPGVAWADLARRAGVTSRTLQFWREKGPDARPHPLTVRAVAEALGCDEDRVRRAIATTKRH